MTHTMGHPPGPEKPAPRVIVTTHQNADFDALASMVAAGLLYPDATLVFPGAQERSLRDFYLHSATYLFNLNSPRDLDFSKVELVVLTDCRQRARLVHVAEALERPGVVVHAFDHHPDSPDDVPADELTWRDWGSTTTIIGERLMERGAAITSDEATLFGLGLYEDTGSFTFPSTTPHDLRVAAWLRESGMDVNVISDLLTRGLSAEQIGLLNQLLETAVRHDVGGVEVVVADATTDRYVGDFAQLAHTLMDMENLRALFALGRLQDRIAVVARSRAPEVDVGRVCAALGGGGHPQAASAMIKDKSLSQVKDEIFTLLLAQMKQAVTASTLMSHPAKTVRAASSRKAALEFMTRFDLKAAPVVQTVASDRSGPNRSGNGSGRPATRLEKVVGLAERSMLDKAVAHGLGDARVAEYMRRDVQSLAPGDDLQRVMEVMLDGRQGLAPVLEPMADAPGLSRLVGVVTRTDLVRLLVEEPGRIPEALRPERAAAREAAAGRNVGHLLRDKLKREIHDLLRLCGELAAGLGLKAYAVGGFVRDMLMNRPNLDIDLVVEGAPLAGPTLAKALAEKLGGRVKVHEKFQTAVAVLPAPTRLKDDLAADDPEKAELRVDVATARLEHYERPAALPVVELSSIKMDLARRDFTVNALAVSLSPQDFGRVVDYFGGRQDLKDHVLRPLHALSFVEDPTRILRAMRFEQRFGFRTAPETERLIRNAVRAGFFHRLSGARLFHELDLICREERPTLCFRRMRELKLWEAIHPLLAMDRKREAILEECEKILFWHSLLYFPNADHEDGREDAPYPVQPQVQKWKTYLLGLTAGLSFGETGLVCQRLGFTPRREAEFIQLRQDTREALAGVVRWVAGNGSASALANILDHAPIEGALYVMARGQREDVRRHVSHYLTRLRGVKADVTGQDALDLGAPPGPEVGRILKAARDAKLDGLATCRVDQLQLMRDMLRGGPEAMKTQS